MAALRRGMRADNLIKMIIDYSIDGMIKDDI